MSRAPRCPLCGSRKVWKDGLRYLADGSTIQRYICRTCGYRFSELSATKPRNLSSYKTSNCRVGVPAFKAGSKNSAKAVQALKQLERKEAMGLRGPTKLSEDLKSELFNFAWWLRKNGFKEATIESKVKLLKVLVRRGANLADPESVKLVIAKQNWSGGRKENAVQAYTSFLSYKGMEWNPPRYKRVRRLPFIPTEQELDQLISGCSKRMATFLQVLKETGARAGEIWRLRWEDVDTVTRTIRVTPEKGSEPRIFHISQKLVAMLESLPKTYGEYVFATPNMKLRHHANHFSIQRKRLAQKLKNPRLLRIHFHTFRHWKATMEYARTKDIIHVMRLLGHKNIKNTLIYVHLQRELFKDQQQFISKVARTEAEACALIEAGFEYVCDFNGAKIFRKPKY